MAGSLHNSFAADALYGIATPRAPSTVAVRATGHERA